MRSLAESQTQTKVRKSYARDIMIGRLGWNVSTDPFTAGDTIVPNLQTTSASAGENRKAGMIFDNTTSR